MRALLLACTLLLSSGCGTILNFVEGPRAYGGVQQCTHRANRDLDQPLDFPIFVFWFVDLPFTLLFDTATLPLAWAMDEGAFR